MFHNAILALASIAIVCSPCLVDTLTYRGVERSRQAQHRSRAQQRDWFDSMTS